MRTATNHFQQSDHLSFNDDNQFLLAPSRLTYSNTSGKDQLIKKLQEKNQRLMTEIQKIDRVLQQPDQKTIYGNKLPEIHSRVTQQQLQNAYKQIKTYQYEVKKLRGISEGGTYVEQIKKCEAVLKEKQEMSQKLKKQLAAIKKQSMELTKSLKDDNLKQQYETKATKLNTQIKWLRQKLREAQVKKQMNNANREKQLAFIKNLQKNLIQKGFPIGDLRTLKQKYTPKKDNPNNSYYENPRMTARQANKTSYGEDYSQKEQIVQDRTPQAYTALQNQMKLLQKMEKDYQNQLVNLQKQKKEAVSVNAKSRDRLIEVQDQIQKTQNRIARLKKMIDPAKIKPTRGASMPNAGRYGVTMTNSMATPGKNGGFNHLYRNQQMGKLSRQGRRFTDRIKLGKCESKIVAIDFYQNNQGSNLVGIQASYEVKKGIKKGPLNMIHDAKLATKKTITLFDGEDYFKQVQCVLNDKGILIGVAMMSNKGVAGRAGCMDGIRRPLNIGRNQFPACLYGSFIENGIQLLGTEVLQQKQN